jgi:hypothetical protein
MSTNEQANTHGAVQALLPWFANDTLAPDEMALVRGHLADCPQCRDDAAWQQRLRAAEPALPAGLDADRALARLMPRLERHSVSDATPQGTPLPQSGPQSGPQPGPQSGRQPGQQPSPQPWSQSGPQSGPQSASVPGRAARPATQPGGESGNWLHLLAARWQAFRSTGGGWMPWALAAQGAVIAGLVLQLLPTSSGDYRALSNGGNAVPPSPGNVVVMFHADTQLGQVQQILQAQGARVVDGPTVTGAYVLDVPDANQAQALAALKAHPEVQLAEPLNARRAP